MIAGPAGVCPGQHLNTKLSKTGEAHEEDLNPLKSSS